MQRRDIVICESDKNQGLLVLDAADYRDLGLRCLRESTTEVTAADFGCIPDNLETAIIDDIRDRLTEAMEPYAALIQSWEGSDEDWKFKYYVAAMTRNPTTNAPYRIANIRLMPKIGKHDARDVAGVHTTINQPFALIDSIMLAGLVQSLPMFLQDNVFTRF